MEDLPKQVLSGFNISPKRVIKSRLSYICYNKDIKDLNCLDTIIQKTSVSEEKLLDTNNMKDYLLSKGFEIPDKYYMSIQNTPYYKLNGNIYIMKNFIELSETNFSNIEEVKEILKTAAKMHKIFREANSNDIKKICKEKPHDISKNISSKKYKFKKLKKVCTDKNHLSDFDVAFLKNYKYYLEKIEKAEEILNNNKKEYIKTQIEKGSGKFICHSALKEETILKNKDKYYITGFENAKPKYYIYDIADILERYIRKHSSEIIHISEFINSYSSINELNLIDIKLLEMVLTFPERYIKMCEEVYSKCRSFVPNFLTKKLNEIILQKDEKDNFIKGIKEIYK